jgi:uncharacterized protein with FMN-binding domain
MVTPDKRNAGNAGFKLGNNLLALGSAAVVTVYAAGYYRTRAAAQRFAEDAVERRPPAEPSTAPSNTAAPIAIAPRPSDGSPKPAAVVRAVVRDSAPAASVDTAVGVAATTASPSAPVPVTPPPAADTVVTAPTVAAGGVARAPEQVPPHANQPPALRDGTYTGWGTSRHGDIQAAVVIQDGRIVSASIAQCLTRYSCSWIAALPPQVVSRQSPDVDYVSGATQSTNAFYYAIVEALAKAK